MGVVLTDQPFDDPYSSEVITKICELSQELDEYVATQSYLLDTVEENVTPSWLRNKLLCRLLDEMAGNGLVLNAPADDICDSPLLVSFVLHLRSKFDTDRLLEFLKDRSDLTEFCREVSSSEADCVGEIIAYCHNLLPLDEGWELLSNTIEDKPGLVESTGKFKSEILDPVFEQIDALGEPDVITNDNRDMVEGYIRFIGDRKAKVTKYAKQMYCCKIATESLASDSPVLEGAVEGFMYGFEKELGRPNLIEGMDPTVKTIPIGEFRSTLAPKWSHTLEYYLQPEHKDLVPNKLQMCVMVATLYVDHGETAQARVDVIADFEAAAPLLGDRYEKFRELLDESIGNLAMVQEGSGVINVVV